MEERINPEYKKTVSGIYAAVLMRMDAACVLISPASATILYKGTMEVKGGMIMIEIKRPKTILFSFVFLLASGYAASEPMKINKAAETAVMMIVFRKDCPREARSHASRKF